MPPASLVPADIWSAVIACNAAYVQAGEPGAEC
jgi:hypothetical protein